MLINLAEYELELRKNYFPAQSSPSNMENQEA